MIKLNLGNFFEKITFDYGKKKYLLGKIYLSEISFP